MQNIALGKATKNEPIYHGRPSSKAVDGSTATNWLSYSCTHTSCCNPLPWWRVDFGKTAIIYSVKITNRGDCCGARLSNFNIRIGDNGAGRGGHNKACKKHVGVPQGGTTKFVCKPRLYGRYLYIQTNVEKDLTLCEVQAFGQILES